MADLAYVTTAPCGCFRQIVMIDDADPRDVRRNADVLAAFNSGAPGMFRTTIPEARTLRLRCAKHQAERDAARGGA